MVGLEPASDESKSRERGRVLAVALAGWAVATAQLAEQAEHI